MADITECPPETLRERIPDTVFFESMDPKSAETRSKRGWKRPSVAAGQDILWFVTPVSQKDSGVLRYIE